MPSAPDLRKNAAARPTHHRRILLAGAGSLVVQLLLLFAVNALGLQGTEPLEKHLRTAKRLSLHSDDEFYAAWRVLGGEYPVLEHIRRHYPVGTKVSVITADHYKHNEHRAITRMWLALLPEYPIGDDAILHICPRSRCQLRDGDQEIAAGVRLLLIERGSE
jgi:hypothetical protein